MKLVIIILIIFICPFKSYNQNNENFCQTTFLAKPIGKYRNLFTPDYILQLGIFYLNPQVENIEVLTKDTIFIQGKLNNPNLDFSGIKYYFLIQKIKRKFFFKKVFRYELGDFISTLGTTGIFEIKINYKTERILFIDGSQNLDPIALELLICK